jgi:hypothetical protein
MNMAKRARVDSVSGALAIAAGSQVQISPPSNVPLDAGDMAFFASVIDEFARSEWTAHQLELAAMLARTMADLEQDQRMMRIEGPILQSDRGTPVVNPRKTVIQMNASIVLSYRRSLQLHARAMSGETRDVAVRRSHAKGIENAGEGDDLLAGMN